jgi:hypothetical protein
VSHRHCAVLAAWGTAWLQGTEPFDAVLDAVGTGSNSVAGPGFERADVPPLSSALSDWKRSGTPALRLALPVPGDVRGLAGPAPFRDAALRNGQAVFGGPFGLTCGLSPETPSSAPRALVWHRGPVEESSPDYVSLPDAEHELTEAIRETASLFAQRGATSWLADIAPALSDARRAGERLNLPASHPPRAVRLIAQAERLSAVFRLLDADSTGEINVAGMRERAAGLAPLRIAVRRALIAGYNAAAEVTAT